MRLSLFFLFMFQMTWAQVEITHLLGINESHLMQMESHQLTPNTANAFCSMQDAAQQDGIDLQLVSAYRSFARQQQIFEDKYHRYTAEGLTPDQAIQRILEYSTIPGTSRHHWGTDIDITDGNATNQKRVLVPGKFHNNGPFAPCTTGCKPTPTVLDFIWYILTMPLELDLPMNPGTIPICQRQKAFWNYTTHALPLPFLNRLA